MINADARLPRTLHSIAARTLRPILDTALVRGIRDRSRFRSDFRAFVASASAAGDVRFKVTWQHRFPRLGDRTGATGFDPHYVYHTSWAARLIAQNRPAQHHDFASDIRFATLVSAFVPLTFYDRRPLLVDLHGLTSTKADVTKIPLPDHSVVSLSCMHVVEHIGLGRYGDPIDPHGDLKAISELKRILSPGGSLYFVVPIGASSLRFNAHRIYSYGMIREYFEGCVVKDFSMVRDDGVFVSHADPLAADSQEYGCGCFWFWKPR